MSLDGLLVAPHPPLRLPHPLFIFWISSPLIVYILSLYLTTAFNVKVQRFLT